jgi:hypothetical protein
MTGEATLRTPGWYCRVYQTSPSGPGGGPKSVLTVQALQGFKRGLLSMNVCEAAG